MPIIARLIGFTALLGAVFGIAWAAGAAWGPESESHSPRSGPVHEAMDR